MKRKIYTLLILVVPFVVKAQEEAKNFQLGFTVAPNLALAKVEDGGSGISSDGVKAGVSYGVIGDFGFSKNYFFSTAFTITTINAKTQLNNASEKRENAYKVQYLDIPLTLKLKTNEVAGKTFYGQFGLGTGIKIRAREDASYSSTLVESSNKNHNIGSSINIFRLGLIAGAGAEWHYNENSRFITGVTFNNGFTDVLKNDNSLRNSYIALNLGILF